MAAWSITGEWADAQDIAQETFVRAWFHLDGLSFRKVAEFLDIPLGTARCLVHRARKKLKAALATALTEEIEPMVKEVFDEHRLPAEFSRRVLEDVPWVG